MVSGLLGRASGQGPTAGVCRTFQPRDAMNQAPASLVGQGVACFLERWFLLPGCKNQPRKLVQLSRQLYNGTIAQERVSLVCAM